MLANAAGLPPHVTTSPSKADASGSTWLWSRWLSESDVAWHDMIGVGTTLAWPVGADGLGNEGVASLVQRTRASIGYVAYAYARQHHLSDVALPSHDGPVVRADRTTFEAAVSAAHWHTLADLESGLTNEPGARSWPIVGASYALVRADSGQRTWAFFDWTLTAGAGLASDLGYVPLPDDVATLVRQKMQLH